MEGRSDSPLPSHVHATALALRVDSVTREVVTAMRRVGVRTLLLKGPSIVAWLYGDGAARSYVDSDLLVSAGSYRRAGDVLRELGFRPLAYSWHGDSGTWSRRGTSPVDLHRSLIGASAAPDTVWHQLATNTDTMHVGGIDVEVLRVPARALHVALHAAEHGVDVRHPIEDLERALRVTDEDAWREATDIARRIDALPAFAAGLRLSPAGERLAERLELPAERPPAIAVRADSKVPAAIALERLTSEPSLRTRAYLFLRSLVPSTVYMRTWSSERMTLLPPALRQGALGVGLAYLWRPIWILLRLRTAITAVRRARRGQA